MDDRILCIYDNYDFDGKCSAAIVLRKYPKCELLGFRYYDKFDAQNIVDNYDVVVIVDVCLEFEDMLMLQDNLRLHWIDHHAESKKMMGSVPIKGSYSTTEAACELTWTYLFPNDPMPKAVGLLGLWDMWNHDNPDVTRFQNGIMSRDNKPLDGVWESLLDDDQFLVEEIMRDGDIVAKVWDGINRGAAPSAIEIEIDGMSVIAINNQISGSKQFDSIGGDGYDMQMVYRRVKEGWKFSCYSVKPHINVGAFCAKYPGGGGRNGCGGFQLDYNPWKELC